MNAPQTTQRLTALDVAVLETLSYSDVFDYPLMSIELHRNLPFVADLAAVESALSGLDSVVTHVDGYYCLRGREHILATRKRHEAASSGLLPIANRYGRLIARLPFVRMVALTGSLAVQNAGLSADIDYLIVTAKDRVWTARAFVQILVRAASLAGVTICPNFLLDESALTLSDRDRYTARELVQMSLIAGSETFGRMLTANDWWRDSLPNATPGPVPFDAPACSPGFIERPFRLFGNALESRLYRYQSKRLSRRTSNDEVVFSRTMCKGHFEGWRSQTERAVAERMQRLLAEVG